MKSILTVLIFILFQIHAYSQLMHKHNLAIVYSYGGIDGGPSNMNLINLSYQYDLYKGLFLSPGFSMGYGEDLNIEISEQNPYEYSPNSFGKTAFIKFFRLMISKSIRSTKNATIQVGLGGNYEILKETYLSGTNFPNNNIYSLRYEYYNEKSFNLTGSIRYQQELTYNLSAIGTAMFSLNNSLLIHFGLGLGVHL